jgi:hypothetical protein
MIRVNSKEEFLAETRELFMNFGLKFVEDHSPDFFEFEIDDWDEFMKIARWVGELIDEKHQGFTSEHYGLIAEGMFEAQREFFKTLSHEEIQTICDELERFISDGDVVGYMVGW